MHELLKRFAAFEPVVELARMAIFLSFLALVIYCARSRDERRNVRRARRLIGFVLAITIAVGIIQVDAWPFTNWALVHTMRDEHIHSWELEASDATGRSWVVDPRILQPIAPEEFGGWLKNFATLPPEQRTVVLAFLYRRAESARQQVIAGHGFPANDALLGPLSAPYHFAARKVWRSAADVPAGRFASLQIVMTEWNISSRARLGDSAVKRRVAGVYRPDA